MKKYLLGLTAMAFIVTASSFTQSTKNTKIEDAQYYFKRVGSTWQQVASEDDLPSCGAGSNDCAKITDAVSGGQPAGNTIELRKKL